MRRDEAAFAQPGEVVGGEVRLVRAELDRSAPTRPAPGADGGYAADERLEGEAVVGVRAGHGDGEQDSLGIGQHVQFAALLAVIDRVRPGQRSPLFARADAASTIAEVQSSSPRAPRSRTTWQLPAQASAA